MIDYRDQDWVVSMWFEQLQVIFHHEYIAAQRCQLIGGACLFGFVSLGCVHLTPTVVTET